MYCKKCGKEIADGLDICEECLQAEAVAEVAPAVEAAPVAPVATPVAPVADAAPVPVFNKKKCVLGMVFGIIGFYLMISMFMSIPMSKMMIENMMREMDQGSNTVVYVADAAPAGAVIIVGGVFALAFAIVSAIMGALGLVSAINGLNAKQKAIPGLVMAAIGLVLTLITIILFFVLIGDTLAFIEYLKTLHY